MTAAQPMQLILVRHASSTRASEGVWGRLYDAPLAAGFGAELQATMEYLQAFTSRRVVSSPLLRCLQTAAYVAPGATITPVPKFRAYDSGIFETMTEAEVHDLHPDYPTLSFRERFEVPQYGEESIASQGLRVASGLREILSGADANVVIVGHYSSLNLIAHLLGDTWEPDRHADGLHDIAPGAYLALAFDAAAARAALPDRAADLTDQSTKGGAI
jgi:broad specificity phosphatase PhoE